ANDFVFSYGAFHSFSKPPSQALNPVLGFLGGTLEGYGSVGEKDVDGAGARALLTSRFFASSFGADWDIRNHRVDALLSWQTAIRRGGLFGHGSMLRVDWLPTRDRLVRVGVTLPTFQPLAGRVRPQATTVSLP